MLFLVIFLIGKRLYIMVEPTGNMLVKVSKCIGVSLFFESKPCLLKNY